MAQETKVKVRLDTRQAKGELNNLSRDSKRTAGKLGQNIRSVVGRGMSAVGLGAGIGAGISAVKGAAASGVGDIISESTGAYAEMAQQMIFGDMREGARASRRAREETIQAFGAIAGARNEIPPEARQFYNSDQEPAHGRRARPRRCSRPTRMMRGPGIEKIIDRIMSGFGKMVSDAMTRLVDALNPFSESK
jgi:hypothetical protein